MKIERLPPVPEEPLVVITLKASEAKHLSDFLEYATRPLQLRVNWEWIIYEGITNSTAMSLTHKSNAARDPREHAKFAYEFSKNLGAHVGL